MLRTTLRARGDNTPRPSMRGLSRCTFSQQLNLPPNVLVFSTGSPLPLKTLMMPLPDPASLRCPLRPSTLNSNATRSLSRGCGAPRRRRSSLPRAPVAQGASHRPPACVRFVASSAKTESVQISGGSGVIASGSKKAGAGEPLGAVPTRAQLRTLFMHSAVPMVGFGEAWHVDAVDSSCLEIVKGSSSYR